MITSVKGMRDLLPPETRVWNRLEETTREVFSLYGYDEIRTPVLEPTELFVRSVGEASDIVHKEMYSFTDKGGDDQLEAVTATATVNGNRTTVRHDIANAAQTVTSPEGRTVTTTYDPNTLQPLGVSTPGLLGAIYEYRPDGRLVAVSSGARATRYTYDTAGNVATSTDPLDRVTRFPEYDGVGRIRKVVRPDTTILQFDYDANGNMTLYRTPYPADNGFDYNRVNNRSSFITPLGRTTSDSSG